MPPPRPCWPALSPMCLREVGYPPHLAGLALWEDWRGSYLYSELIPSVTERSTLIVKEFSFPQTAPTDDVFSTGTGLERVEIVGPELELPLARSGGFGRSTPLQKQETKGDRRGLTRRRSDA